MRHHSHPPPAQVRLAPHAAKDDESTHNCVQVFHVLACQPRGLQVTIGDHHFLLAPGDQFFVPAGTVYSLVNHSPSTRADLGFIVIKPQPGEEEE